MTLADHVRAITANWWRLLLVAGLVAVLVFAWSKSRAEVFQAGTLLSVAGGDLTDAQFDEEQLAFRADFYGQVAETDGIAADAVERAGLDITPDEALDRYRAVTNEQSGFILIQADGPSPEEAEALAAGVADALAESVARDQENDRGLQLQAVQSRIQVVEQALANAEEGSVLQSVLENQLALSRAAALELQTRDLFRIDTIAPALAEEQPILPRPTRDAMLAGLVAFVLAAEAFVIYRALSDRLSSRADATSIAALTGLPVLGMVPTGTGDQTVEAFRTLRTNLLFLEGAGHPRTVALVGPDAGSGKSTVAAGLARSAASLDTAVTLVDGDLRRPVLHERFGVERAPGLSDVLGGTPLDEALRPAPGTDFLTILPSGAPVDDPSSILAGRAFRRVLETLEKAELVVVDTPAGQAFADAVAVAAQCDAAVVVVDAGKTRKREAQAQIETLQRTGATLVGVVVNNAQVERVEGYDKV